MVLVHVDGALSRQQVERGDAVVVERHNRPAVAAVGLGIPGSTRVAGVEAREQRRQRLIAGGSLLQQRNRTGKTGARGRTRGRILLANERLSLGGPWHYLGVEQGPG